MYSVGYDDGGRDTVHPGYDIRFADGDRRLTVSNKNKLNTKVLGKFGDRRLI